MSKKFSISEGMLNGISKNVKKVTELEAKEGFKLEYIDINKIHRSEKNFYEIIDIDDLAEDIKINGLNHNLVVRPTENGTYELISGERRFTALSKLVFKLMHKLENYQKLKNLNKFKDYQNFIKLKKLMEKRSVKFVK